MGETDLKDLLIGRDCFAGRPEEYAAGVSSPGMSIPSCRYDGSDVVLVGIYMIVMSFVPLLPFN